MKTPYIYFNIILIEIKIEGGVNMTVHQRRSYFNEFYRICKEESICLNDEYFKKDKDFMFTCSYRFGNFSVLRLCHNLREYCKLNFYPLKPKSFKLENGHIVGSVFDYIRFRSIIKHMKQFIEENINIDIDKAGYDDIEYKVIAKISQEEIEKVENIFKITKLI